MWSAVSCFVGVVNISSAIVEDGYRFTVQEANERTIIKLRVEAEALAGQSG